jgi:hypothetical protein
LTLAVFAIVEEAASSNASTGQTLNLGDLFVGTSPGFLTVVIEEVVGRRNEEISK